MNDSPIKTRDDFIVNTLCQVARPAMLKYWDPDSCIAGTRIACDVLGYFDIDAKPLPVFATVGNDAAFRVYASGESDPDGGATCLFVDRTIPGSDPEALHLVAITPTHLLDMAADQFSRPNRDIVIPHPLWTNIEPEWPENGVPVGGAGPGGSFIIWRPDPSHPFNFRRKSLDWKSTWRHKEVVAYTIRILKLALDSWTPPVD